MTKKDPGKPKSWQEEVWDSPPLMGRTHIKHDTYLSCWCPHCQAALNEEDQAVFEIVNGKGEVGTSKMKAYLNVLEQESTLHLEDDQDLADVRCPHCRKSFIVTGYTCIQDGCKLAAIDVSVSNSQKLKLITCTRPTCRWYTMSEEDNERLILRDSHEW